MCMYAQTSLTKWEVRTRHGGAHLFSPSTQEAEEGRSLVNLMLGQPRLHQETLYQNKNKQNERQILLTQTSSFL